MPMPADPVMPAPNMPPPDRKIKLTVVGSGPTSVLVIGAFVDRLGGWDKLEDGDIAVIGNNYHNPAVKESGPVYEVRAPTHPPGMGRLGLYTTMNSNTSISGFNDSLTLWDSLKHVIDKNGISLLSPIMDEYDSLYNDFWHEDLMERSCRLYRVGELYVEVFKALCDTKKVVHYEAGVTDLDLDSPGWETTYVDLDGNTEYIMSERVFLTTGVRPKLDLPKEVKQLINDMDEPPTNLDVEEAMNLDRLQTSIPKGSQVALIGYSHCAAVVGMNLNKISDRLDRILVYNVKGFAYNFVRENGEVENDNTGLKQGSAYFTKTFIDPDFKTQPSKFQLVTTYDGLTHELKDKRSRWFILNCTGYERDTEHHHQPAINLFGTPMSYLSHCRTTGQMISVVDGRKVEGLFAYGPGFPNEIPASEHSRSLGRKTEANIGLLKFTKYLKLCLDRW